MLKRIKKIIQKTTFFDKVIIFLVFIAVVSFAYIFFRKVDYLTVSLKLGSESISFMNWDKGSGVKSWYANRFYAGMKELDGFGKAQAEVLEVKSFDTYPNLQDIYLKVKLRVVYNRASNQHTFKGVPLLVGSTVRLNLDRFKVNGLVTNIEGQKENLIKKKILVQAELRNEYSSFQETSGVSPYLADALKIGDEFKNNLGETIVKLIGKRVEDAKRSVPTSDGRIVIARNPLRKDVYLTFEVEAKEIDERFYIFDDFQVLVGQGIPFNTQTYSIWPEVTDIRPFK